MSTSNNLTVTQRNLENGNVVIFRWNEDLTECDFTAGGVPHDEVDDLLDRMMLVGAHEGNDFKGWETTIN